ncbi:restriction endonuclease subunit S [Exiguobacterium sp. s28]|uniref:restriction endonuclease subunit S n=1 Tax=Exiguobacterium sp. s28 TaxID=2751238 RepID=UPI001BE60DD2|nr:restriction endonuclease subunit S [Exiguobacterium sp. s28]
MSNRPFFGFNNHVEEWEEKKFLSLVNRVSTQSSDPTLPKIEFEDIVAGEGKLNKDISNKFDSRRGVLFEPGFILFGKLRPYLKNWLLPNFAGVALGDFWVFKTENDSNFIYYLIQTNKFQKAANLSTGTKMPRSDWNTVSMTCFFVPSFEEQKKIGSFFKRIDDTISLHQHEFEALKKTKQGFLQKMFPRNGESIPELRFPEFKSEWQNIKLNNVASIISGGTPDTKEPTYWEGEIDWYSPTEIGKSIYVFGSVRKITQLGLDKSSAKILPANKTILFTSRAGIGDTAILKKDGCTNQGFQSLVVQDNCDVYFLYSMSKKIKNYALKNASGSTFLEITGKKLGEMPILIPSMEEQIKIGEFFRQLDEVIELKEKEIEALKETKKGFLQKMFV